MNNIFRGTVI